MEILFAYAGVLFAPARESGRQALPGVPDAPSGLALMMLRRDGEPLGACSLARCPARPGRLRGAAELAPAGRDLSRVALGALWEASRALGHNGLAVSAAREDRRAVRFLERAAGQPGTVAWEWWHQRFAAVFDLRGAPGGHLPFPPEPAGALRARLQQEPGWSRLAAAPLQTRIR